MGVKSKILTFRFLYVSYLISWMGGSYLSLDDTFEVRDDLFIFIVGFGSAYIFSDVLISILEKKEIFIGAYSAEPGSEHYSLFRISGIVVCTCLAMIPFVGV